MDYKTIISFVRFLKMSLSKIIFLFLFFLLNNHYLFSQKVIDSIRVCGLPVAKGMVYQYERNSCFYGYNEDVSIITKFDSVFNVEEGTVAGVFQIGFNEDRYNVVTIKNDRDEFISYGNLRSTILIKGERVLKGAFIALAGKSYNENGLQIDFMLFKKEKRYSFNKLIEYLKCNSFCDEPGDYTL